MQPYYSIPESTRVDVFSIANTTDEAVSYFVKPNFVKMNMKLNIQNLFHIHNMLKYCIFINNLNHVLYKRRNKKLLL